MPGTLSSAFELRRAGRLDEAEAACRRVLAADADNVDALTTWAGILEELGRPAEARERYRRAVTIAPGNANAQLNLGLVSLLLGDYAAGWRGYEWRIQGRETAAVARRPALPVWDGSDPAGRTIVVRCEPDARDCLQFARYLPLLGGRRADVVLVCPRPLVRLFGNLPGVCVVAEGDPPPRADACVAIGSLPRMFGTTPATIPTFGAYVRPNAHLAATWRDRLRPVRDGSRKLIGLACGGGDPTHHNPSESIALEQLAPLGNLPGVRFVALQTGAAAAARLSGLNVVDLTPALDDLADVASVVAHLDVTIADGSSPVAHLAGALGKRCWTLVPFAPDWRWGLTVEDSPWYPSMRLLRQPSRGDWAAVADELTQTLKQELALSPAALAA